MTVPVDLSLRATKDGLRMFAWPVVEIETLRTRAWPIRAAEPCDGSALAEITAELLDLSLELRVDAGAVVSLEARGTRIEWSEAAGELVHGEWRAPLRAVAGALALHVLVDRCSIEVFANGGRVAMSLPAANPGPEPVTPVLRFKNAALIGGTAHALASTWQAGMWK
jgi:sucrose-6-phosphate hydrolase SacC (GH32 family)